MSKNLIKLIISFFVSLTLGIIVGDNLEEILGISGFFFLIAVIILIHLNNKKLRKKINKIEEEEPELIELTRIMKSKNFKTPEKNDKEALKSILNLALFGLILGIWIYGGPQHLDIDIIIFVTLASTLLFLMINYIVGTINTKKFFNYINNLISNKYGQYQLTTKLDSEVIEGDITEIGNIRKKYIYSCKILNHKCILTDYYLQELRKDYNPGQKRFSYSYKSFKHVIEYRYNLKALGLDNVEWAILGDEKVLEVIKEFEKIKILEFSIDGDYLLIEKETVLYGHNKEDVERDINDVELFFNKLVKIILERK